MSRKPRPLLQTQSHSHPSAFGLFFFFSLLTVLALAVPANAAVKCVNPGGTSGCSSTISAAIAAASPGDTIYVAPGTYKEDVVIGIPVSIVGRDADDTIIDATGLSNGIYIDGLDNLNLAHVVITGLTVENANFEGILAQNASYVTISGNIIRDNDKNLVPDTACTGQPAAAPYETNEGDDCGEGLHLMGLDHSIVSSNFIGHNAGGILVSDETAANHDNVITRNTVRDNSYDCGITVASHGAYVKTGPTPHPFGIFHITISDNDSIHNGFGSAGGGAGVGLFAPAPGNKTYDNSVVRNRLIDNALPGVAIHNHAPVPPPAGPDVNDNSIVGNYISGNGPDADVPTTVPTGISVLGASPVTGLVIAQNVIENESIDVAVNSASPIDVHWNDLGGYQSVGVDNINPGGTIDATANWWGCYGGPGANGCSSITGGATVVFTPWLKDSIRDRDDRDDHDREFDHDGGSDHDH